MIEAETLGQGWLAVSRAVLERGVAASWGGLETREVAGLTLAVERPDTDDPIIARLGDPAWLAWMHDNFFVRKGVAELGGARSYASRLFDYGATGRDQLAWVVDRLRADPTCRDATITTFEPLTDTSYIPCVEHARLLAARRRRRPRRLRPRPRLRQEGVRQPRRARPPAGARRQRLALPAGRLLLHVKTAHVYATEWELMARLTDTSGSAVTAQRS